MSDLDIQKIMGTTNTTKNIIKERVKNALIVNIYTNTGECIKLGGGSPDKLTIESIYSINDDSITIAFSSHLTDIFYSNIVKIEYYNKGGML